MLFRPIANPAVVLGAALATAAVLMTTVDAQPPKQPAAYVVIESTATDAAADAKLAQGLVPIVHTFGGRFVARRGRTVTLEGDPPHVITIIQFDNVDKAQTWADSPARRAIEDQRRAIGTAIRSYVVEAGAT